MVILVFVFGLFMCVNARRIPFINDAALISTSSVSSILINNVTCQQCLCQTPSNSSILNCFPNNTCQIFDISPLRYQIQSIPGTRLLFPNGILPKKSACCMSNLTQLIALLHQATWIKVNITDPRCLVLMRNGHLIVPELATGSLHEFYANNLTRIRQLSLNVPNPWSLTEHNGTYYISSGTNRILVVNSSTFSIMGTIIPPTINSSRDILFLNNGDIMVVAGVYSQWVVFLKRVNHSPTNYTFLFKQSYDSITPHGLWYVNDTFFYVTSWKNNRVYSFTQVNTTFWQDDLFIDAGVFYNSSLGYHITVDQCNRYWYAMGTAGFLIFDENGSYLTSYKPSPTTSVFHAQITRDYVMYISDMDFDQVLRIDPNISC